MVGATVKSKQHHSTGSAGDRHETPQKMEFQIGGREVMSRVKVTSPEQFLFSMERRVGISDVNYARHLDSVTMVQFLHEARLQFLASLGFTEANIFGLGMVVTDMAIDYRSESFANDCLIIDVGVSDFNRYGLDIGLQVTNSALESVVCNAKIGVVFFDFDKHQISPTPNSFRQLLEHRLEKQSQVA
jgi:acyl-CoA thioesterase FadM